MAKRKALRWYQLGIRNVLDYLDPKPPELPAAAVVPLVSDSQHTITQLEDTRAALHLVVERLNDRLQLVQGELFAAEMRQAVAQSIHERLKNEIDAMLSERSRLERERSRGVFERRLTIGKHWK